MNQEFETSLKDYLSRTEQFVQHVHDSLEAILEVSANAPEQTVRKTETKKTPSATRLDVLQQKKILIVDDAEINRVLMGHFFKNMPMVLEFAGSGEQAVEKSATQAFDLILMDLQMKTMSGSEAIKTIRAAESGSKKSQIIAISNQAPSDDERNEAISSGANEYLSRSMSRDAIRERVFEILLGKHQISA